jgi:DHA1 family bicyclomycin/chloramphenicol resistance-like MFS transporter
MLLLAGCSVVGPISTLVLMPALPSIRTEFGASTAATQAVVSAFLFAFAAGIPFTGPLSDRYGRRPVLLFGLLTFFVGSLLAAVAPTLEVLIFARIVQALGCSASATVSRAVLGDVYRDWRLAQALATLTLFMMMGTSISPYLGGWMTERLGWHAPFLVLIGLSAITGLACLKFLPETRVVRGELASARKLAHESLAVLRRPVFVGCMIDAGVIYALYLGFISVAPYIMSEMLGKPATEFGIYVLFLSVGYFLGNFVVSRIRGHAQLERVARFGTILQAVSACTAAALVLSGHTDPIYWFGPMLPLAFAQGLTLPHVTASAVRLVPNYAGVASSMIGLAQQAAAAIAVQGMGFLPTNSPVPVLSVCAALSLISLCVMMAVDRALRREGIPET